MIASEEAGREKRFIKRLTEPTKGSKTLEKRSVCLLDFLRVLYCYLGTVI
jgi:hypothetical protein